MWDDDYDKELENIKQYPTYKIVLDGKIIGGLTCCNAGEYYWLGGIYISKAYQNQGIGAKAIVFLKMSSLMQNVGDYIRRTRITEIIISTKKWGIEK